MEKQVISSGLSQSERKFFRSLLTKKGRKASGSYIAEGVRLLEEAEKFKKNPTHIYYVPSQLKARAKKLVNYFVKLKIPVKAISNKDLNIISDTETSQGLLALFKLPYSGRKEKGQHSQGPILLLDSIADPGNAGTLVRSALAFGFETVLFLKNSVEPFNPKVVRASVGALFGLRIEVVSETDVAKVRADQNRVLIIADPKGEPVGSFSRELNRDNRIILAIGSEASGLSSGIKKLADIKLRVTHEKSVESLNAGVAGSIIMNELYVNRKEE